jgi:PilZ domain
MESADGCCLSVVIYGVDFTGKKCQQSAIAHNLSTHGARLDGIEHALVPGTTIELLCDGTIVAATVLWLAVSGSAGSTQAGIRLQDPKRCPWRMAISEPGRSVRIPERRKSDRYKVSLEIQMRSLPDRVPMQTTTADVGIGGCYVETMFPLKLGVRIEVLLWLGSEELLARGIVRTSYPGLGMGIEFLDLAWEDMERLYNFLECSCPRIQ